MAWPKVTWDHINKATYVGSFVIMVSAIIVSDYVQACIHLSYLAYSSYAHPNRNAEKKK